MDSAQWMCILCISLCCYTAILKLCAYPFATRYDVKPGPFQNVKNGVTTAQRTAPDGKCRWHTP